jgi:hypothetical protein
MAEAALWFATWNLREAVEEDPRIPVWGRVLVSTVLLGAVAGGVLVTARMKGVL